MIDGEIFGYLGSALNITMLIPQIYKAIKSKDTTSLSLLSILAFLVSCIFWTIYGFTKESGPVILTNIVVGMMNLVLAFLKLRYK